MAMTANNWYYITLSALTGSAWSGANAPLPGAFVDAQYSSSSVYVFCLFDGGPGLSAIVAYNGGNATFPSDAVTIVSTPAMNTQTMDNGETWYSIRVGTTAWYWYGDQSGIVRTLSDSTVLGAFIS